MATLLHRIGRLAYRRAWVVIGVWLVVLAAVFLLAGALGGSTAESFAIPGTESQQALDRLDAVYPHSATGASAQIVMAAPRGHEVTERTYRDAISGTVQRVGDIPGIRSASDPLAKGAGDAVSEDGRMAIVTVRFAHAQAHVAPVTTERLQDAASIGRAAGMQVEFGGGVFQDESFGISPTEVVGVAFAGLVLFITFGSLLAAGMPLLTAILGVGITTGGITVASAFTQISSTAPFLALMIGLAVGIDYALFILSRHRNQLARGMDPAESAATAVGTAGSAVVFAGLTVIIALLGLLVVGIPFLSVMGVCAAAGVLVAILSATTLLPAVLGLARGRLRPRPGSRAARRADAGPEGRTLGLRWVQGVMRAPWVALVGVVVVLGVLAVPAASLQLTLPDSGSQPRASTERKAYDLIAEGFGPGQAGPLIVLMDITQTTHLQRDLGDVRTRLQRLDDVASVSPAQPDAGVDTAIITVTPRSAPTSAATRALVQRIRDLEPRFAADQDLATSVTGSTAVSIDISNRLHDALVPFILIVVGLSVILLMIVFRSLVVPLKAAAGFILSVGGSIGITVAIFQWGWLGNLFGVDSPGPILSFLPIILVAVLFGLAMDYEVFLVSGMREEFVTTGDARHAVRAGFGNAARVVTAAAMIMCFVFFSFVPGGSGTIKPIALGLAAGIAFDAFLVRMTFVPAVMTLLGRAAWWLPAWLGRVLPDLDIEGEHLRAHQDALAWVRARPDSAIGAEQLVVDGGDRRIGPISVDVPRCAVVVATGEPTDRRLVAATLAGRLDPASGRLHVHGHPLPSESTAALRLVALADLGPGADGLVTVGALFAERLGTAGAGVRSPSRTVLDREIGRVRDVLGSVEVTGNTLLVDLSSVERAVTIAAAALLERTPVVMIDLVDPFAAADDEHAFLRAVLRLAHPTTTLLVGAPTPFRTTDHLVDDGRQVIVIDLAAVSRKDLVR